MNLLLRIVTALQAEAEPQGRGTMFDNTLIVYTGDAAEVQHSSGMHWMFLLIGNNLGSCLFRTLRAISELGQEFESGRRQLGPEQV